MKIRTSAEYRGFTVDTPDAAIEAAFALPLAALEVIRTGACILARVKEAK